MPVKAVIVFVERLRVCVRGHVPVSVYVSVDMSNSFPMSASVSVFVSVEMFCGDVTVQCYGDVIVKNQ